MPQSFTLKLFPDDQALATGAARDWLAILPNSFGPYSVAVSGGRIAKTFFEAIVQEAKSSSARLDHIHFFFADERCVDPSNPESNFRLAQENLFEPLGLSSNKIHRLKGEWLPMAALTEAIHDLKREVHSNRSRVPVLDMIFLGLGEDGHTASLMPNAPPNVMESHEPYVHVCNSPKPPPDRLSMTYPVLAAAKNVWMMVAGAGKEEALRASLAPGGTTPFARVLQSRQQTVIYTDLNRIAAEWSK